MRNRTTRSTSFETNACRTRDRSHAPLESNSSSAWTAVLAGVAGGLAGTALMTMAMRRMHAWLPARDQYPLPPRRVTMEAAERSGLGAPDRERDRTALTLVGHYAYGTALGGVYGAAAHRRAWPPLAGAVPLAVGVWAGSYLGWLPALGLHPAATKEPLSRNALMVVAHLVWAGTVAAVVQAVIGRGSPAQRASVAHRTPAL